MKLYTEIIIIYVNNSIVLITPIHIHTIVHGVGSPKPPSVLGCGV